MQPSIPGHEQSEYDQDEPPPARLYRQHAPTIFAYLRLHITSREDAEDLLLEVFIAALENEHLSEWNEATQRAWLRSVAHHKIIDRYRQVTRHPPFVTLEHVEDSLYADETRSPEQVALLHEEFAQLATSLNRLPLLQRQVLHLRFVYGLQCSEIAAVLHKREGAVRKLLSRAYNFIRTIYAHSEEEIDL